MSDKDTGLPPNTVVLPPDPMSEACSRFLDEHWQVASLLAFGMMLAYEKDATERRFAQLMLQQSNLSAEQRRQLQSAAVHGAGAWNALMTRKQMLLQILLSRAVDSYLIFLADLLSTVFSAKPETLHGDEQWKSQEFLQFKTMEELLGYMAEKKVYALSYKGMRELAKYLETRLGFKVCEQEEHFKRIILIIEVRNLIAHNRAVINRIFKDRVPDFPGKLGDVIALDAIQTLQDVDLLANSVCDIEERAAKKWGYPCPVARQAHDERMRGLHSVMDGLEKVLQAAEQELAQEKNAEKSNELEHAPK